MDWGFPAQFPMRPHPWKRSRVVRKKFLQSGRTKSPLRGQIPLQLFPQLTSTRAYVSGEAPSFPAWRLEQNALTDVDSWEIREMHRLVSGIGFGKRIA